MADTIFVMSPSPGFFHIQSQQKVQSLPVAKTSLHVPVFVQPLSKTRRSIRPMPMFDPTFYGGFGSTAEIVPDFRRLAASGQKRSLVRCLRDNCEDAMGNRESARWKPSGKQPQKIRIKFSG